MSQNRWQANLQEILDWVENGDADLSEILAIDQPSSSSIPANEIKPTDSPDRHSPEPASVDELPILPLRSLVVYPQTGLPLTVGQPRSIRLVDDVVASDQRMIGLVTSRDSDIENPGPADLYQVGTIAVVHRLFRAPDGTIRLLVQGISRFKLGEFTQFDPYLKAKIIPYPESQEADIEIDALARNARDQFSHIAEMIPSIPRELVSSITSLEDPTQTVYTIANFQRMDLSDAQEILEISSIKAKLHKLVGILTRESEVLDLGLKIQNEARSEIDKVQRDYFLREQLKAIQKELGETDDHSAEINEFRTKIIEAKLSVEAEKQARRELERLERLPSAAAEYGVIRTYLDWLVSLPWTSSTEDNLDIIHARKVLEADHYGLEDVKERILEFLAVRKLRLSRKDTFSEDSSDLIRKERESMILCFIGPPGVGKTSLGQSIARSMGRKFVRISLGGVRDEAEIRGHRRTYIGALPGRILQALRRVETNNPVFMMDEIDKLSQDYHGDPASALLEVLDPEQNNEFRDNYLEVAYDLSQVLFITTANQIETIPSPLLDRMEVIRLSGYTEREKVQIATRYLVPRQLRENGLLPGEVDFKSEALETIIRNYTREAGVRNLEREIGSVCRKIATLISEEKAKSVSVTSDLAKEYLGRPKYYGNEEIIRRTTVPGVATGLAWTPAGGDILFIEASRMPGQKGFMITGSVGNVMQESAQAALSYIRSRAGQFNLDPDFFQNSDIHLHIPSGAQPKDGPSAGVTIATALVSLLSGRVVKGDVGMTGELTLRGQVMPVGGIKEKVLAAHRAGLKTLILPRLNEPDLDEIPEEVRQSIHFIFVEMIEEVIANSLDEPKENVILPEQSSI